MESSFFTFEKPWEQVEKEFQEYELCKDGAGESMKLVEESTLLDALAKWQRKTSYMKFRRSIEQRVMGQKNLGLFLLIVYRYIATAINEGDFSSSVILAAPSGCGKTETFRALRDYFRNAAPDFANVITQIDASALTPNGYKGTDISIITESMEEYKSGGVGIVFLDEFDKVLAPINSSGEDLHTSVIHELLTLIEGKIENNIDTGKTLFVCAGAFDSCRKNRKAEAKSIGFITDKNAENISHYSPITKEDILSLGAASHELMGRMSMLINYEPLDYEAVDKIITVTTSKVEEICDIKLEIGKEMRKKLHEASNSEYGCRLFYNIILEETIKSMTDIYEKKAAPKCKIIVLKDIGNYEPVFRSFSAN